MNEIEQVLKRVEGAIIFLKAKVEKGEDFSLNTAAKELERITNLYNELFYFKAGY